MSVAIHRIQEAIMEDAQMYPIAYEILLETHGKITLAAKPHNILQCVSVDMSNGEEATLVGYCDESKQHSVQLRVSCGPTTTVDYAAIRFRVGTRVMITGLTGEEEQDSSTIRKASAGDNSNWGTVQSFDEASDSYRLRMSPLETLTARSANVALVSGSCDSIAITQRVDPLTALCKRTRNLKSKQ